MKKLHLVLVLVGLLLCSFSCKEKVYAYVVVSGTDTSTEPNKPVQKHRFMFNCDGTDLLGNFYFGRRPLSLADVHAYVDVNTVAPVNTFMMCSGSGTYNLFYRSAYTRVFGEAPEGFVPITDDAPAPGTYIPPEYYQNFLNVEREGADFITAVLQRARKNQVETFLTLRMNDAHFTSNPKASPLFMSDFWLNYPEYRIVDRWWSFVFDYAHREVRMFQADIIAEQLDKYGHLLDGFDLDFMRFPFYFKEGEGEKNAPLMTEFIRAVKQKIDEASERTGRKILLSVRVPSDMDFSLFMGLDVKEWVREDLVDMVIIGVFEIGHPAMPVAKYRHDLGNDRMPVYGTIDRLIYSGKENLSHGQRRGMAAQIYAQGGSGICLFNHFEIGEIAMTTGQSLRSFDTMACDGLDSPEKLRKRNKIFALDDGGASYFSYVSDTPLPLTVTATSLSHVELYVADDVCEDIPQEAILFLRTVRPESMVISVNDTDVSEQQPEYVTLMDRGNNLSGTQTVYAYLIPLSALKQGYNRISITSSGGEARVMRLEIALKYGDVETHGYF